MTNLPDKIARRIQGRCCYGACAEPAVDADYCPVHDAKERARDSGKKRRQRQRLADDGLCVTGCGAKVTRKRRGARGPAIHRRCSKCSKVHRAQQRDRRGVPGESRGVPGIDQIPAKRGRFVSEQQRPDWNPTQRYVGRDRRGAPSRDERDDEVRHELTRAVAELTNVRDDGIALLRSEQVTQHGREAKRQAAREIADRVLRVARVCRAVADDLSPGRAAEIDAEMSEAVSD